MANTLKFGNGEWATKEGSTLAFNDENGNFKPLPFNFERSTSATRVNKEGLIEVVSNNEPRIDFYNPFNSGQDNFYGNTKQIQYFDTALNDTDLETLTSWTSFNEMATSQLYSIQ